MGRLKCVRTCILTTAVYSRGRSLETPKIVLQILIKFLHFCYLYVLSKNGALLSVAAVEAAVAAAAAAAAAAATAGDIQQRQQQ